MPPLHFTGFYAIIAIKAEVDLFLSRTEKPDPTDLGGYAMCKMG